MSTIIETLENAKFNLDSEAQPAATTIAKNQLHHAITLLNKGYSLYDDVESLLGAYGDVDKVPKKKD